MARYQSQAVLRRAGSTGPLVLVGVTLDATYFPRQPRDERGRFTLSKGRVALAPLSPVDADTASEAAEISMVDALDVWNGRHSPDLPKDDRQRD